MDDPTKAAIIASPHWAACSSCVYWGKNGCILDHIDISLHLDWIVCDEYREVK
uniref:Uncharacterized protein n=1 Tax=viral metagenome TaxID=1070528 RepID=A0A6M3JW53_9ZZZZ